MFRKYVSLFLVAGLSLSFPSTICAETYIGTNGYGIGQLQKPIGIALNKENGLIYIADAWNSRVQVFDVQGNYINTFGKFGIADGDLKYPVGVAINSKGEIYISDIVNNRIEIYDKEGNYLREIGKKDGSGNPVSGFNMGEFNSPVGITIDKLDRLYVADQGNARIQIFDNSDVPIKSIGTYGTADSQFQTLYGVTVDSNGNIYGVDYISCRVQKFDSNGTYLYSIGKTDGSGNYQYYTGEGGFSGPIDVKIDELNNLYILDRNSKNVEKYDENGNYIETLYESEGFDSPESMYIYNQDTIFISDTYNDRIKWDDIKVEELIVMGENSNQITTSGGSMQMNLTVRPSFASYKDVNWETENIDGDANISVSGILTAIKDGKVKVKANAKDGSGVKGETIVNISNQGPKIPENPITTPPVIVIPPESPITTPPVIVIPPENPITTPPVIVIPPKNTNSSSTIPIPEKNNSNQNEINITIRDLIEKINLNQSLSFYKNGIKVEIVAGGFLKEDLNKILLKDLNSSISFKIKTKEEEIYIDSEKKERKEVFEIKGMLRENEDVKEIEFSKDDVFKISVDLKQYSMTNYIPKNLIAIEARNGLKEKLGGFYDEKNNELVFYTDKLGKFYLEEDPNVKNMIFIIGEKEAQVNQDKYKLEVEPILKNKKPMIPLRFLIEHVDADIVWNKIKGKAVININNNIHVISIKNKLDRSILYNDRILTDALYTKENLDFKVFWIEKENKIIVVYTIYKN